MKKILIFSQAMELGGVEKSLLGLLEAIDYTKYSVDLFLMRHSGELMQYIPAEVNLLPEIKAYASLAVPIMQTVKNRQYFVLIGRILGKFLAKRRIKKLGLSKDNLVEIEYSHKYTKQIVPQINNIEYDLAISFLTPHYFVDERVKAKKKIAWIHTDYSRIDMDINSEFKMWNKYNCVIAISDAVANSFSNRFPGLTSKLCVIENILPNKLIADQANEFDVNKEMKHQGITLLSIGRYCVAKNFDNIPEICSKLVDIGLDVYWYIIGYGSDENLIKEKIEYYKMQKRVILLGKKENPYPYIKACDIYIQPSRYEGKSVTVREAQMLGKPVIITNYPTAISQLDNGVDGIIVSMDNDNCAKEIADVIKNEECQKLLRQACCKRDYSNKREIIKLEQFF